MSYKLQAKARKHERAKARKEKFRPFAPSPLRPFAPSPLRPFALSPLRPFALSPLRPFAPSPFRPFVLSCLLLLSLLPLSAQADSPIRIEMESAKDQQDYKFVSLAEQGAAVFYPSAVLSADTMQWVFIHYDTNLVRTNLYKLKLPNLCQHLASDFFQTKLYLFLQKPAFKKDTLKNYLLEWDMLTHNFQLYHLQNYLSPYLTSIKVADDYVCMVVDESKMKSMIYYNYKTDTKQVVQFTEDEITSMESFGIDTLSKETYVCLFLRNKKETYAKLFVTDYSGRMKRETVLPLYPDIVYNSAKITLAGKDSLLITGGYSNMKDKKNRSCYSGIYTLLYTKNRFSDINIYSLGALLDKDADVKTKYLNESNLAMNGHVRQSNGHIFYVTELFYPEYQYTSPRRSYGYYGYYDYEPATQIFAGFRLVNAYIFEFNPQGILLNEWYFPISNVLTQSLYNLVDVYQDNQENTLMYYVYKNEIVSQFMNGQRVLEAQSAIPVDLAHRTDILEYSSNVSMRKWYGNTFLLSGYQYIKNSQRGKGKRYVFFLNKLVCE